MISSGKRVWVDTMSVVNKFVAKLVMIFGVVFYHISSPITWVLCSPNEFPSATMKDGVIRRQSAS